MPGPPDFDALDAASDAGNQSATADAVELEFLDDNAFAASPMRRNPGPGMWESLAWILSFFALEFVIEFAWVVAAVAGKVVMTGEAIPASEFQAFLAPQMPYMIGLAKFIEVFFFLAVIRWRFGPGAFRFTGFRPVPALHLVILALVIIPTAAFSGQLYAVFTLGWEWLVQFFPVLEELRQLSSIEAVQEMARSTPLMVLIVVVAVLPALQEEFLFRGLIGRGLVGRYGVIAGIALTSMLFAAVHLTPTHVAALIPLAVVMHVAYLSSGSIWLPVLVHFLNNALSVIFMVIAAREGDAELSANALDGQFDVGLLIASGCCVTAAVWLLWRSRVRWRLPDGSMWRPVVPGVASPPEELEAKREISGHVMVPAIALLLGLMLFTVAYGVNAWRMTREAAGMVLSL